MSKYGNRKTEIDGIKFDSKKEANRYAELKLLQRGGEIDCIRTQPRFELQPAFTDKLGKKHRKIEYVADFYYYDPEVGYIVEDVKGMLTDIYRLKKKLFLYKFPEYNFIET